MKCIGTPSLILMILAKRVGFFKIKVSTPVSLWDVFGSHELLKISLIENCIQFTF